MHSPYPRWGVAIAFSGGYSFMQSVSGTSPSTPRSAHAGPPDQAGSEARLRRDFLDKVEERFDQVEACIDQIDLCKSDLPKAQSQVPGHTTLRATIDGICNDVQRKLVQIGRDATEHLGRGGVPGEQATMLENHIASVHLMVASTLRSYSRALLAIGGPDQQPRQMEQLLLQSRGFLERAITATDAALTHHAARKHLPDAVQVLRAKMRIADQRVAIAKDRIHVDRQRRQLYVDAGEAAPNWPAQIDAYSRAAHCLDGLVARQQQPPFLDEEYREIRRVDLSLLVEDHDRTAKDYIDLACEYRKAYARGSPLHVPSTCSALQKAHDHAVRAKYWASVLLKNLDEPSQRRATTGTQSATIATMRTEAIVARSEASATLIESVATMGWLRREQVERDMRAVLAGDGHPTLQRVREWLREFNLRSATLEGTLQTQLIPMLTRQRIDGHVDVSSHALLHSAVQNLRVLEQEALAMAASAQENGLPSAVVKACEELARQKSQICLSLDDDLKRLQDYADLVAEPEAERAAPAPKAKKKRRSAAAGRQARSGDDQGGVTPASPAPVLFETIMEGTLAGHKEGELMLVNNSLTGQVTSYRQGGQGLWQRVVNDGAGAGAPAVTAPAPDKLTGAAKIADRASQYRDVVAGHLLKMEREKSFVLAQYYHKCASVAQAEALNYLDNLAQGMKDKESDAAAIAAVSTQKQEVTAAGRGMGQRLLDWAKRQPQYDGASLAYLLENSPNAGIQKTVNRKLLNHARLTRAKLELDYMDEYQIAIGHNESHICQVHVHYRAPTAELTDFNACHLKYGSDELPIRKQVRLELLKKIAAKALPSPA